MNNSTAVSLGGYDAITSHNALNSPLLRLPAELHNAVYAYVVTEGKFHLLSRINGPHDRRLTLERDGKLNSEWPNLLSLCRQIHGEASLLPYMLNAFSASDPEDFDVLFAGLSRLNHTIDTVHLEWECSQVWDLGPREQSELVVLLPSIQKVAIDIVRDRRFLYRCDRNGTLEKNLEYIKERLRKWAGAGHGEGLKMVFMVKDEGPLPDWYRAVASKK